MSFESRLRKETPRWVADGIITANQAERIEARHPEHAGAAAHRFLAILILLGAVLCLVGLALIVSANWENIHRWVKIAVLVLMMAGAYSVGFRLKLRRGGYPKFGDALIMAGCVLFMLGIGLVSQIFHLDGRPGDAVLVWIAGIAAIPFLTRAPGAFFVLFAAVYAWLVIESTAPDGWLRLDAGRNFSGEYSLPFVLLGGSLVLYWTAFLWRRDWRGFAAMQQAWPVAIVCATVYLAGFSHKQWWNHDTALLPGPALTIVALMVIAALAAAVSNWNEWRMLSPWLVLAAAPALVALGNVGGNDVRIATSVLSWVTLLALNVFMARAGLQQGKPWLVNVAIGFIALNLFTRYFDIFGTMLNQGLMFLVSGAVVLGLGWFLERKRRDLLSAMKGGGCVLNATARWFALVVLAQALFLLGWAGYHEWNRGTAPTLLLEAAPVDPRDLLRGDYLILSYKISRVPAPAAPAGENRFGSVGRDIWVTLRPAGRFHEVASTSWIRPTDPDSSLALVHARTHGAESGGVIRVDYGIEKFFVPEGRGRPTFKTMVVEATVSPGHELGLKHLLLDGKVYP